MAWSGGTFTGLHNWVTDQSNAIRILASRHKAQDDVFIAGINSCIEKSGSNAMTGNFNAGSNRLTSLAAATAATDAPIASQIQDGSLTYAVDTGSANTYAISLTPNETAYAAGQVFFFKSTNANSGASTLNVDSIGAIDIKKYHNVALVSGDIVQNQLIGVVYDATTSDFVMITPTPTAPITTTTAAQTNITSLGTLTSLTIDNLTINGNTITADSGALNLTPASGSAIVFDGTINVDAGVVTGATSITSTAFVGDITGDVTGNASGTAGVATTVTITDNESTNEENAIIFTSGGDLDGGNIGLESDGDLKYNPSTGTLTSTAFAGALTGNVTGNASGTAATVTGAAQAAITSLGTLTTLTVDNITLNASSITSSGTLTLEGLTLGTSENEFILTTATANNNFIDHTNTGIGRWLNRIRSDMKVTGTTIWQNSFTALDDGDGVTNYIVEDYYIGNATAGSEASGYKLGMWVAGAGEQNVLDFTGSAWVFNEAGADVDFRIESDTKQYMFYVDGAKNSVLIGNNGDTSSTDQMVKIERHARTATADTSYYDLMIQAGGPVTIPTGTTAIVATAGFFEPDIIATGTVTAASTVYIYSAPIEGSSNYALWVDAGASRFDGTVHGGNAAGPALMNEAATSTNPTLIPDRSNAGYGIGANVGGGELHIIANSTSRLSVHSGGIAVVGNGDEGIYMNNGALRLTNISDPGNIAGSIKLYSKDSSAGSTDSTLAMTTETNPVVVGTFTPTHKFPVWINGTEYHIQLDAV